MGKSSKAGWFFAVAIALGWLASGEDGDHPPTGSQPIISASKRTTAPTPGTTPQPPASFYTAPTPAGPVEERLFTTANVKMRSDASTASETIMVIPVGSQVVALGKRGAWRGVRYGGRTGWVSSRYLADNRPSQKAVPQVAIPVKPAPQSRRGEPTRAPMVGRCDCPYDIMRNGARCGGRSAYSRPGGRSPTCYW